MVEILVQQEFLFPDNSALSKKKNSLSGPINSRAVVFCTWHFSTYLTVNISRRSRRSSQIKTQIYFPYFRIVQYLQPRPQRGPMSVEKRNVIDPNPGGVACDLLFPIEI